MKKITFSIFILLGALASGNCFAAGSIKTADIQKINLGDTVKKVTRTLGQPQEVLAKELTTDGKEQITWRYEVAPERSRNAVNPFSALGGFIYTPPRVDEHGYYHQGSLAGGLLGESPGQSAAAQQAYQNSPQGQAERAHAATQPAKSTCTVIFTNGKVSSIKKQEVN